MELAENCTMASFDIGYAAPICSTIIKIRKSKVKLSP
jgi:hypothetical protein